MESTRRQVFQLIDWRFAKPRNRPKVIHSEVIGMERNEISIHETRAFAALVNNKDRWITSNDLAGESLIAQRTARAFLLKFTKLGIVDLAEVFPAHRYRLAEKAGKRNAGYVGRLEKARLVFGI